MRKTKDRKTSGSLHAYMVTNNYTQHYDCTHARTSTKNVRTRAHTHTHTHIYIYIYTPACMHATNANMLNVHVLIHAFG